MTKYKREDGKVWATCIHCKKEFDGSSKKGTTHLKNHLESCRKKRKGGEDAEKSIKTSELTSTLVVKQNSVIDLIKNCFDERGCPTDDWDPYVLNSRKVDILQIYEEEKEKLRRFFSQLSGRVSLRINSFGYWSVLTAHYIDEKWEPNSKIISCLNCECCDFIATLKAICLDLKIDGNIYSVVNDYEDKGYAGNVTDDVIGEINSWYTQRGSLPFGCYLVLMNSSFYHSIYNGTTEVLGNQLGSIRNCVAYVKKTPSNQVKFKIAVDIVKFMGKKVPSEPLPTDVSFVADLKIPLGYKEAFCELEQRDPDFKIINLTKEKWDEATAAEELLNSINNVWRLFLTNSTLPNMYFSRFCDFYVKLLLATSDSYYHGKNTSPQIETFASMRREFIDKYWSKYNFVLVITVILDPRFKMEIVQLWYDKIYGCDADHYLEKIKNDFNHVYNEYAKGIKTSSISYLDNMGRPCASSLNLISPNSELHRYLNEPKCPPVEEFDILPWWRAYSPIFPTLARMARDFLAVPISRHSLSYTLTVVEDIIADEELDDDIKQALFYLLVCQGKD